ncbi:hypothetical protein ASPSYDRAFT_983053 [Aspergillus sydowii CBS 593.65]|uniref:Uncharacterized protein n=1 Tax=Aspergillus sydowii CBS 593.65 TaxID=1036612 RepID=A0A1L9THJ3_9EURO|nr:uncharacterized protein ASPSYDRAFT_983053 [Aspergillus sydowii CBS 593.65]OJJ58897.1 hypothetical protein ASPSYDRAFT_983053 [Aspergillus sydowii CBS 593.65]
MFHNIIVQPNTSISMESSRNRCNFPGFSRRYALCSSFQSPPTRSNPLRVASQGEGVSISAALGPGPQDETSLLTSGPPRTLANLRRATSPSPPRNRWLIIVFLTGAVEDGYHLCRVGAGGCSTCRNLPQFLPDAVGFPILLRTWASEYCSCQDPTVSNSWRCPESPCETVVDIWFCVAS